MLLTTRGLSVVRAKAAPIIFPDLTISPLQQTLILGPSGCGKTTFLSVLAGLLKPDTGSVLMEGKDIYALTGAQRDALRGQSFGFVFQNLHLLAGLNIRQNVALAASMANMPLDNAYLDHILDTLGLMEKSHRKPHELSQGEQQRVAIARAIINRPKIIIADEPTSALDDINADKVIDLLQTQALNSKAALLIATHDARIMGKFSHIVRVDTAEMQVAA